MRSLLFAGLVLAVLAGVLAAVSGPLTLESIWPLFLAAGVALVPGRGLGWRLVTFVAGLIAAWVAFALRAGVLPDIPMGRAVFAAVPVLIVLAVVLGTAGRAPLWAGLAGLAAFGSAYHPVFSATPTEFAAQSVATMTTVLLAAGIGAAAAMLLRPGDRGNRREAPATVSATSPEVSA